MVVFVDLEDESEPPERGVAPQHWSLRNNHSGGGFDGLSALRGLSLLDAENDGRANPNKNVPASAALSCYPYVCPHFISLISAKAAVLRRRNLTVRVGSSCR